MVDINSYILFGCARRLRGKAGPLLQENRLFLQGKHNCPSMLYMKELDLFADNGSRGNATTVPVFPRKCINRLSLNDFNRPAR